MTIRSLFSLDPEVTFLNHGSFGATPKPVFEKYIQYQRELENQPVDFLGRKRPELLQNARAALGEYLNVDGEDLAFVPNATTGINTFAKSLPLEPGDEILTTNHEYGAINMTWERVCEKTGAKIVVHDVPLPVTTTEEFVDSFWEKVTPRTRVIAISHITSPTALIFPLKEICTKAREAGIWTVVDGAHAISQIEVDLTDIAPDFYSGNCHKWLCSAKGAAFIFVRKEHQPMIHPLTTSWGSENSNTFALRHEWQGTRDIASYLTVPDAIAFQKEHGWDVVRQECHEFVAETRERVHALSGLEFICPESWFGQMASMQLPMRPVEDYHVLWPEHKIEVPIFVWNDDYMLMRVSIQAYNTREDVDLLIDTLKRIISS